MVFSVSNHLSTVTVHMVRHITPNMNEKVAEWAAEGQAAAMSFPGYLGSGFLRSDPEAHTWRMHYRFASEEALQHWEHSPERKEWKDNFSHHIHEEERHKRTGVEGWFELAPFEERPEASPVPPRWKQMIVIFTGFFPMSLLANYVLSLVLPPDTPLVLRVLSSIVLVMPLMVYFVLPAVTKMYSPWLNKKRED